MARFTVKQLRAQRSWSQARLAAEAGITQASVSFIEGKHHPSIKEETARRVAQAFELTPDQIDWQGVCTDAAAGRSPGSSGSRKASPHLRIQVSTCGCCFMQRSVSGACGCGC